MKATRWWLSPPLNRHLGAVGLALIFLPAYWLPFLEPTDITGVVAAVGRLFTLTGTLVFLFQEGVGYAGINVRPGQHFVQGALPVGVETGLKPCIGKRGSVVIMVSRTGPIGFTTTESNKLTGVELRPDGLVRLDRDAGWTVLDPAEVVAVGWNGDPDAATGQFL